MNITSGTHYEVLGVDSKATAEDIKRAYRKLVRVHHPDRGGDSSIFVKVQEAYDTLSSPGKRIVYDRSLEFNIRSGSGSSSSSASSESEWRDSDEYYAARGWADDEEDDGYYNSHDMSDEEYDRVHFGADYDYFGESDAAYNEIIDLMDNMRRVLHVVPDLFDAIEKELNAGVKNFDDKIKILSEIGNLLVRGAQEMRGSANEL